MPWTREEMLLQLPGTDTSLQRAGLLAGLSLQRQTGTAVGQRGPCSNTPF